jgi:hypothetical protein
MEMGRPNETNPLEERSEMLRRFVLTGAPGAGKTALAVALRDRGYVIVAEAATDVIADEHAHGIAEPWRNGGFLDDIVRLQRQRQLAPIAGDLQVRSMTAHRCARWHWPVIFSGRSHRCSPKR